MLTPSLRALFLSFSSTLAETVTSLPKRNTTWQYHPQEQKAFQRSCSTMGGECGEKLFAIPGLEDAGGWL
jgi:hypothetical protein